MKPARQESRLPWTVSVAFRARWLPLLILVILSGQGCVLEMGNPYQSEPATTQRENDSGEFNDINVLEASPEQCASGGYVLSVNGASYLLCDGANDIGSSGEAPTARGAELNECAHGGHILTINGETMVLCNDKPSTFSLREATADECPRGLGGIVLSAEDGAVLSVVCFPLTCADGVMNGDESDTDCGGSCDPCPIGAGCNVGSDCESGECRGGYCERTTLYCSSYTEQYLNYADDLMIEAEFDGENAHLTKHLHGGRVIYDHGEGRYRMWVSIARTSGFGSFYENSIVHYWSADGLSWNEKTATNLSHDGRFFWLHGPASVMRDGDLYRMWTNHYYRWTQCSGWGYYSTYSTSSDGITWGAPVTVNPERMVHAVLRADDQRFMIYWNTSGDGHCNTRYYRAESTDGLQWGEEIAITLDGGFFGDSHGEAPVTIVNMEITGGHVNAYLIQNRQGERRLIMATSPVEDGVDFTTAAVLIDDLDKGDCPGMPWTTLRHEHSPERICYFFGYDHQLAGHVEHTYTVPGVVLNCDSLVHSP